MKLYYVLIKLILFDQLSKEQFMRTDLSDNWRSTIFIKIILFHVKVWFLNDIC